MHTTLKIIGLFCFAASMQAIAEEETLEEFVTEMLIDVGNTICPVTGSPIKDVHVYVHNGKTYNLCCSMCVEPFANEPEKYAAIAEAENNTPTPEK